ncbi:MAG: TSUP family transporter [Treponema sp.]|nr:TSUP family transporter [Treponema sp.]
MDLNITAFFFVCPLVFLAGFVDSIAGGGGLVSLPAYLIAGVPIHFALGTNKCSSTVGAITASFRYYRNGYVDLLFCLPSIAAALAGSALGSFLTLKADERYLQWLLIIALPVTAFYVFKKKNFEAPAVPLSRGRGILVSALVSFVIGGYDGFFGPGTGTFLILLYTGAAKIDPRTASGNAKLVNLASNLAALVLFLIHRRVILPLGLAAGVFSVAGAYLGSGLVIRRGARVIRYVILAVLGLLFIKIVWDLFRQTPP